MSLVVGILIGLLLLAFLVVAHEFGHAIAARRSGVVIEEFGIGMPPMIWSKRLKNGIIFSVNWLMFGGFVKLQGEYDSAKGKGDYGAATFWQKTKILFAGVAVNWLVAVVILTTLAITGLPKVLPNQFSIKSDTQTSLGAVEVSQVVADSPAAAAGLQAGDIIRNFDGIAVKTDEQLISLIESNKSKNVVINYLRGKVADSTYVVLGNVDSVGYLGVSMSQSEKLHSTWSAPITGVAVTAQFTYETLKGLGELLGNLVKNLALQLNPSVKVRKAASAELKVVSDSVAGPVGIVGTIFPQAQKAGLTQLALLTAIISISLATMNILPIPALDGGRWMTMALFRLARRKLTIAREERIQTIGFMIMMGLVLVVTIVDVKKLF